LLEALFAHRGGGVRDSRLLSWKPVRKFGDSRENLKLWGLQWKLESLSVTGTPVKTWKRESSNFLTSFHGSKEFSETGDWDIFLGPTEQARAETSGADQWVLKRRELPGLARVNKVTSASLGYPLSVFNKKLYTQRVVPCAATFVNFHSISVWQRWISHFPPLYDEPHSHGPDSDNISVTHESTT